MVTQSPYSSTKSTVAPNQRSLLTLLVDGDFYRAQTSLETRDLNEIVDHYVSVGWKLGVDPAPTFQGSRYLNANPRLQGTDQNPFCHYLFDAVGEDALSQAFADLNPSGIGRLRSEFDANWYLHRYPDVETGGYDPFVDYMVSGWRTSRDPSPRFSTAVYLDRYSDVRDSAMNPFQHWVFHGQAEGRSSESAPYLLGSWANLSDSRRSLVAHMFELDYYRSHAEATGQGHGSSLAEFVDAPPSGRPTPSFRASRYLATHPACDPSQNPFLHFLFAEVGEQPLREMFLALPAADIQRLCAHFDTAWYLYSNPDIEAAGVDAFIHYMVAGWRERRDPSSAFSTGAYLVRYPDIAECGMNPFLHWVLFGQAEGRIGASSSSNFRSRPYTPSITAILLNSDADPLSPGCLAAVLHQSYPDLSVRIVGAPLSDECRATLDMGSGARAERVAHLTADASAPSLMLLERAAELATDDLLWFVQGHATPEHDFISRMASSFADGSVQLGFGRPLEQDDYDAIAENPSRQLAHWRRHSTTPAAVWFAGLDRDTLAADQPSFVWRRRTLALEVWRGTETYRSLGLWHLYLHMASGGQIASVRDALIRIPDSSQTPLPNVDLARDAAHLADSIRSFWNDRDIVFDTRDIVSAPVAGSAGTGTDGRRHVLIVTHGIFAGGAENFPIQLANALVGRGIIVSMLIFKTDDVNPEMRATLDPGVSIYEAEWVLEYGCDAFVRDIGCSLIHSHGVVGEMFFFVRCDCTLTVPYIATLHGSYEASTRRDLPESMIAKIVGQVDLFVYTADKNLAPLIRHDVRTDRLVKMINAMPVDPAPFPQTRAEMGIADGAIVFTLVARGIPEKGWRTAIAAFEAVRRANPHRAMHLCLVGEGDEPDRLKPLYRDDPGISFLGFQLRIHGLYRLTDIAIVPTRFAGESFPLCIIQALQSAVPVIATDVGEIAAMLQRNDATGGVIVESSPADTVFDQRFAGAMQDLLDEERRMRLGRAAHALGRGYDMDGLTDQYVTLYETVLDEAGTSRPDAATERAGSGRVATV